MVSDWKKLALAGLGLLRLSSRESSGLVERLAAVGRSFLNTEAVPNEPLHYGGTAPEKMSAGEPAKDEEVSS